MRTTLSLLVLGAFLSAATAFGQIVPCNGITASQQYKLVIDDFRVGNPNDRDLSLFMEALKASLRINLGRIEADIGAVELVRCENRKPQENDFDSVTVRQLNSRRVIVEMWGIGSAANPGDYRAYVTYVVIPARNAGQNPAIFTSERQGRSKTPFDALGNDVSKSAELKAYVALGIGTKFLEEGNYDQARRSLCRAETWLIDAGPAVAAPAFVASVKKLAASAVELALKDSSYTGTLQLFAGQPVPPCLK